MSVNTSPTYFATQSDFRKWLVKNHNIATELLVGFYKVGSGKPSLTWSQAVDEALCFGWIDSVRKSIDRDSYNIRFTPRKALSIWSAVNIIKVEKFISQGLMRPSGLVSFKKRTEDKSKIYAHENAEVKFSHHFEKQFKANKRAWNYFQSLAPSYRKPSTNWVMSAKQETTRMKRLNELIADSKKSKNKWKENKYKKK